MNSQYVAVVREFIDFVNLQVGLYMDAAAGFQGHKVRTERQVFRITRPDRTDVDSEGNKITVWASYEDPSQPDVIHNRIIRADGYIEANSEAGVNFQQLSRAVLIFIFTYWEDETRRSLASAASTEPRDIRSDIMGDLRILRNSILHSKAFLTSKEQSKLTKLSEMFQSDAEISISYEGMHQIFVLIKQSAASLIIDTIEGADPPIDLSEIKDVAIQFRNKRPAEQNVYPNA